MILETDLLADFWTINWSGFAWIPLIAYYEFRPSVEACIIVSGLKWFEEEELKLCF